MTYPGRLRDRYTVLGAQTMTPKKPLFKFSFFSYISNKNTLKERSAISNASNYFEMASRTKIQTREKQGEKKMSKRKVKLCTSVFIHVRYKSRKYSFLFFFISYKPAPIQ